MESTKVEETKINELTKDAEELKEFLSKAARQRVKDALTIELRKTETEILKLKNIIENAQKQNIPEKLPTSIVSSPKRYTVEIKSYAWDQSEKFVKIFVNFENSDPLTTDKVAVEFTERSINLKISDFMNKDHTLVINNLLEGIDVDKSHWKTKKDMVTIFMNKTKAGVKWSHVTSTEKRLKESKTAEAADDMKLGDASDPGAGLMNVLKKMYDSGDPEMKRMINKAWHDGQDKKTGLEAPGF